jgi:hypothetical protein
MESEYIVYRCDVCNNILFYGIKEKARGKFNARMCPSCYAGTK